VRVVCCRLAVPTTTISAEKLTKSFPATTLFSDLSFAAAGGLVAVSGPNGSGKTTFLKILAGLLRPSSGRVRIEPSGSGSDRRLAVGWAGPDLNLYGELTARKTSSSSGSPAAATPPCPTSAAAWPRSVLPRRRWPGGSRSSRPA